MKRRAWASLNGRNSAGRSAKPASSVSAASRKKPRAATASASTSTRSSAVPPPRNASAVRARPSACAAGSASSLRARMRLAKPVSACAATWFGFRPDGRRERRAGVGPVGGEPVHGMPEGHPRRAAVRARQKFLSIPSHRSRSLIAGADPRPGRGSLSAGWRREPIHIPRYGGRGAGVTAGARFPAGSSRWVHLAAKAEGSRPSSARLPGHAVCIPRRQREPW